MVKTPALAGYAADRSSWSLALSFVLPLAGLELALFYYWFALADRYFIFLYYHDMGSLVPDTGPFSPVTASRYWMAGLVAGGLVMLLYTTANWLLGRLRRDYLAPAWWRVWLLAAGPLLVGLPWLTMTVNQPTLPLFNAAQITLAALAALALALTPGRLAARQPGELVWLIFDGGALMVVLLLVSVLEEAARRWAGGSKGVMGVALVGIVLGLAGLLLMSSLRLWRRTPIPRAAALFTAGLTLAYLLMPLVHYLYVGGVEDHYYLTDSANFFARTTLFQLIAWLVVVLIALGITRLRLALKSRLQL